MDVTVNNKIKYVTFKVRARRFLVRNKWKKEKDIILGDYVIVLDPTLKIHYLTNMKVLGHTPSGRILVTGTNFLMAHNTTLLKMEQCSKLNDKVHTLEWRKMVERVATLKN